jgi:hypothetical protein
MQQQPPPQQQQQQQHHHQRRNMNRSNGPRRGTSQISSDRSQAVFIAAAVLLMDRTWWLELYVWLSAAGIFLRRASRGLLRAVLQPAAPRTPANGSGGFEGARPETDVRPFHLL